LQGEKRRAHFFSYRGRKSPKRKFPLAGEPVKNSPFEFGGMKILFVPPMIQTENLFSFMRAG
jgi:hypothetical protein